MPLSIVGFSAQFRSLHNNDKPLLSAASRELARPLILDKAINIDKVFVTMPSRLAALKKHLQTKSPLPSHDGILPGVGYIQAAQGAGNGRKLQRSNTSLSTSSSATAVTTSASSEVEEKVVLQLAAGAELPHVPYKLRFAVSLIEIQIVARTPGRMLISGYKAVTSGVGRTTRGYCPASGTLRSTTLGDTVVPPSLWVS